MQSNNPKNKLLYHHHRPSKVGLIWAFFLVFSYFGLYEIKEMLGWSKQEFQISAGILLIVFIGIAFFINYWRSAKQKNNV